MKVERVFFMLLAIIIGLFLTIVPAQAHKVNIFAYSEGDTIFTESYFPDGRKVQGGKVEVYDSTGTKLMEGLTGDDGVFNFRPQKKDDLKIVLIATMGHKNSFLLEADEIEAVAQGGAAVSIPMPNNVKSGTKQAAVIQSDPSKKTSRHMEPPKESHAVAIMVGLGFIFGLTSLILHFTKKDGTKKS